MTQKKDRSKSNLNIKKNIRKKNKTNEIIKNKKIQDKNNSKLANVIFGLDNGSTGTISCIIPELNYITFMETPSKKCLDYSQQLQYINRIDINILKEWFEKQLKLATQFLKKEIKSIVILQRPMVNPQRFKQSGHALRAFEATIIILEQLKLNYIIIDSKKWQHYYFGKNTSQIDLKNQSLKLGIKIIQENNKIQKEKDQMIECIKKHGDADGLLICKYGIDKLI